MKPSDDRLDPTATHELASLLSWHYTVQIVPARGLTGATVRVCVSLPPHTQIAEGRSHDLSHAMHRAYLAVEAREQDAGVRK